MSFVSGSWARRPYAGSTNHVLVATKGGHLRPAGRRELDPRREPSVLREAAQASAKRLGVEQIGCGSSTGPTRTSPYEESIGALKDLLDEGLVGLAGISNADVAQIRQANDLLDGRLAWVQNQFSPAFRTSGDELRLCVELGIAFLPWSPLGGVTSAAGLGEKFAVFAEVGEEHGVSPQVVCLAWELALADVVIPIPSSSRPQTITDSATAPDLELTVAEVDRLSAAG